MSSGTTNLPSKQGSASSDGAIQQQSVWARRLADIDRYDAIIIAALFAAYLVIQLGWLLREITIVGGDQLDYFTVAGDLQEPGVTHRHLRIGLTMPVRLLVSVFGYSEVAYYALPITAGLLFLAATYVFGALLHSRSAGMIGAIAGGFSAHVLWDSSHLLPDLLGAGLFTAGLVVVGASTAHDRRWSPILVAGGLLLGWSYLVREFIVIFFPLVLLVAWSAGRVRIRALSQVAFGALLMLGLELLYGALVLNDPLARIRAVSRKTPAGGSAPPGTGLQPEAEQSLSETALILPRQILNRDGGWFLLTLAALLVIGYLVAVMTRRHTTVRRLMVPLLWMLFIYAVMTAFGWMTTDDGGSVLRVRKIRYWYPIFPALAVGGAMALLMPLDSKWLKTRAGDRVVRWIPRAAVVAITVVAAAASYASLQSVAHSKSFVGNGGGSEFRELRQWLATEGGDVERLYVDSGHGRSLSRIVPIFTRTASGRPVWHGEIEPIPVADPAPVADQLRGVVVVHSAATSRLASRGQLPPWLTDVPANWPPILVSDNGKLAVFATGQSGHQQSRVQVGPPTVKEDSGVKETDVGWELDLTGQDRVRLVYTVTDVGSAHTTSSIELTDDVAGEGSLTVECSFENDVRTRAFNVTPAPGDPAASEFFCAGPRLTTIELVMEGPLEGTIEAVEARITTLVP